MKLPLGVILLIGILISLTLIAGIVLLIMWAVNTIADASPTFKPEEQHVSFKEELKAMLIRDEVGGTTVTHMLTVTHDGATGRVVGIGHEVVPADNLEIGDSVTLERVVKLFRNDVDEAIRIARRVVHEFDQHPENVQIVTAALAFQLGEGGLKSFKHMLLSIKERDYEKASAALLASKLAREQSHNRAHREAELLKGAIPKEP